MRVTVDIERADINVIRMVKMDKGTIYHALQHFINFLANECRRNKWTLSDSDKLEQLIHERCPTDGTSGEGRSLNDLRGVAGVREDGASTSNERPARKRKQTTTEGVGKVE